MGSKRSYIIRAPLFSELDWMDVRKFLLTSYSQILYVKVVDRSCLSNSVNLSVHFGLIVQFVEEKSEEIATLNT